MGRYFVGVTGASGHAYATRLIQALVSAGQDVDLSITAAGEKVLRHELGIRLGTGAEVPAALEKWLGKETKERVRFFARDKVEAPPSSGTALTGGVLLAPCSMGTMARVAVGFSSNLVERAADVALKEGRRLILVPRETPLSEIHLENMLKLARMGAVILPAAPGFYHGPKSIDDLVDHVVGKVLDRLGLANQVGARWEGLRKSTEDPAPEPGIEAPDSLPGESEGG